MGIFTKKAPIYRRDSSGYEWGDWVTQIRWGNTSLFLLAATVLVAVAGKGIDLLFSEKG